MTTEDRFSNDDDPDRVALALENIARDLHMANLLALSHSAMAHTRRTIINTAIREYYFPTPPATPGQ